MSNHKRGSGTRIYDKFEYWSVEDCDCIHCVNYAGNGKPCPLDKCCIEDIRQEAMRREIAAGEKAADAMR